MSTRAIRTDAQGPYILYLKRKFRPDPKKNNLHLPNSPVTKLSVTTGADCEISFQAFRPNELRVTQWGGTAKWKSGAGHVQERWTTTDPKVAPKKSAATVALEKEQRTIKRNIGYCSVVVIVTANGQYTHGSRKLKGDMHLAMNGGTSLSFAEWDNLVAEVQKARDELPLAKIAAKLEEEIKLEDELQTYLKEKGLV